MKNVDMAIRVYNHFHQSGLPREDNYVNAAMLNMYTTTENFEAAKDLFYNLQVSNNCSI